MLAYGKIFVVVTVLAIILVGIFGYLFYLDKKVNKLKKEVEEKISEEKK